MLQLLAFSKSVGRFMTGGERPGHLNPQIVRYMQDPEDHPDPRDEPVTPGDLYAALGNALRAGRVIDLRLSEHLGGGEWWREAEFGDRVPGLRYARNAVEHDQAELIAFPKAEPTLHGRSVARECIWRDFKANRQSGRASYQQTMVGQNIVLTLTALNVAFTQGVATLAERGVAID